MVRGGGGGLGSAGRNTTTTAAAASSSHAAMLTEDEITTEDFKQFVCSKAYDIITEGRYRKYLVRCKAASDEWALSAQRSVSLIQGKVKQVIAEVKALDGVSGSLLGRVCAEVMSSLSPPTKIREGTGTCCITGVSTDCCIDLSPCGGGNSSSGGAQSSGRSERGKYLNGDISSPLPAIHEGDPENEKDSSVVSHTPTGWKKSGAGMDLLVHPKLSHFFLMLWYVCKIEHVVRNYTRCWLDERPYARGRRGSQRTEAGNDEEDPIEDDQQQQQQQQAGSSSSSSKNDEPDIHTLCNEFSCDDEIFESMCVVFKHAISHVIESVRSYIQENTNSGGGS